MKRHTYRITKEHVLTKSIYYIQRVHMIYVVSNKDEVILCICQRVSNKVDNAQYTLKKTMNT
jgi:CDGSH-type Zn-finger protein